METILELFMALHSRLVILELLWKYFAGSLYFMVLQQNDDHFGINFVIGCGEDSTCFSTANRIQMYQQLLQK